jgi:hypothetical protein
LLAARGGSITPGAPTGGGNPGLGIVDLEQVWSGSDDADVREAWAEYQRRLTEVLADDYFPSQKHYDNKSSEPLKVLIVTVTEDSQRAVDFLEANLEKLQNNSFGDTFDLALFIQTGSDDNFKSRPWYTQHNGQVVMKQKKAVCKAEAWLQIQPAMAGRYDWIWLLDGDIGLDMFSWDLYRVVLANAQPLVSQPSIIPRRPGELASDIPDLDMKWWMTLDGSMPVSLGVPTTGTSCVMLSAFLWPAVHSRLATTRGLAASNTSVFWDIAAWVSRIECFRPPPTLVNVAPVRHMYELNLTGIGGCTSACAENDRTCQLISEDQWKLMGESASSYSPTGCGWASSAAQRKRKRKHYQSACDQSLYIRGCSSFLARDVDKQKTLLFTGEAVVERAFRCEGRWPDDFLGTSCKPDFL